MNRLRLLLVLVAFAVAPTIVLAANVTGSAFPYGNVQLSSPPFDHPWPGLGSDYSTLSRGVETVMWNPASLAKTNYTDASLAVMMGSGLSTLDKKYNTEDKDQNFGGLGNEKMSFFFTGDQTVTTLATREHTGQAGYAVQGTGINYKQGLRINDWLTLGIVSRSDIGASVDTAGDFPMFGRFTADFASNQFTLGNTLTINIDQNGYPTLTITPEGGSSYTQKLADKIWSGFLNQKSTVPFDVIVDANNNLSVSAPLTMAGAAQWHNLAVGLSLTPISASCDIDNSARAVIRPGTPDIYFYQPNLDPNNEQSIQNWLQDPNQYGTELGYVRNTVRVPAGETVAEAKYRGFYTASAARFDLGATYDLSDNFVFGLALENLNGATLDFKGNGITSYVNTRITTFEAPPLDPTQQFNWSIFNDNFSTVEGTAQYYLEDQLKAELPKKIRFGVAVKKPMIIALDYEMNQTPINFKYQDKTTQQTNIGSVTNLSTVRLGIETQMFTLPWWLRSGVSVMLKPTLGNVTDKNMQDSFDKAFKFGVLPTALELGTEADFWGVTGGAAFGTNLNPLIAAAQGDTLDLDLSKVIFYDIYAGRGQWTFSYIATFDPGATAAAFNNRADQSQNNFDPSYIRYVQTLKVTYRL